MQAPASYCEPGFKDLAKEWYCVGVGKISKTTKTNRHAQKPLLFSVGSYIFWATTTQKEDGYYLLQINTCPLTLTFIIELYRADTGK